MSHNINYNKDRKQYSFVSRREVPWHGLGTIVDHPMTSAEAIRLANADYQIGLAEMYAKFDSQDQKLDSNGKLIKGAKVPGSFATYRKDNLHVFGAVGNKYTVVQNIEAFNFIDNIVQTGEAVIETAGVLGDGERCFVTAKLPDYIRLSNNDVIEGYIFITNSHDGSKMITAALTKIRIVCNNTLTAALGSNTNKIVLKHTKNVHERLGEGLRLMKLNNLFTKELGDLLLNLKAKPLEDKVAKELVRQLILTDEELALVNKNNGLLKGIDEISQRKKNTVFDIYKTLDTGVGQEMYKGTALNFYNGITCYVSNVKNYTDTEDRLDNLLYGTSSKFVQKALELVV